MSTSYFPTVEDVQALHRYIMEQLGDPPERLTNRPALEGALERPHNAAHYDGADLASQAAILIVGIAQAHAYPDGNKRTAAMVGDVFLQNNDRWLNVDPLELARQLVAVVTHAITLEVFSGWLRAHLELLGAQSPLVGSGAAYEFRIDLTEERWGAEAREELGGLTPAEKRVEFLRLVERSLDEPVTFRYGKLREFNAVRLFIMAEPEPGLYYCRVISRIGTPGRRSRGTPEPLP